MCVYMYMYIWIARFLSFISVFFSPVRRRLASTPLYARRARDIRRPNLSRIRHSFFIVFSFFLRHSLSFLFLCCSSYFRRRLVSASFHQRWSRDIRRPNLSRIRRRRAGSSDDGHPAASLSLVGRLLQRHHHGINEIPLGESGDVHIYMYIYIYIERDIHTCIMWHIYIERDVHIRMYYVFYIYIETHIHMY